MPYANTHLPDPSQSEAHQGADVVGDRGVSDRIEAPAPTRDPAAGESILQHFAYEHLPPALQEVSKPFGDLAHFLVDAVPRNAERSVALRKILEAKDAAVRAMIAK